MGDHECFCTTKSLEGSAWIKENEGSLKLFAIQEFERYGRGMIVAKDDLEITGFDYSKVYYSLATVSRFSDDKIREMVESYEPGSEFIVLLVGKGRNRRLFRVHIEV